MIGQTLGHYRILGRLGAGGMGEVFLAEDTRLKRQVALKLLPAELSRDPQRLARLQGEAESLASLNHPSIVTIHSIEEAEGVRFLTMERVEGTGLDEAIPASGFAIGRFFEIAVPLAQALAAAHERDVTHRDVKPANVMLTPDGRVKVLDFGLAKQRPGEAGEGEEAATLTQEGALVGTVPYMAPEQLRGKGADARSDVFSLGVVLYEMATGERPFGGASPAELTSAILRDTPPELHQVRDDLPRHLGRIVRRCLEKNPLRRYPTARDLANELEDLRRETESGAAVPVEDRGSDRQRRRKRLRWTLAVEGLVLVAIVVILLLRMLPRDRSSEAPAPPPGPPELSRVTSGAGLEYEPAFSPDGKFLAYTTDEAGRLDIHLLPLAGGDPIPAVASEADDAQAAWSPDGARIAFVSARERSGHLSAGVNFGPITPFLQASGGDLFVAPAFGGGARKVAANAYYPTWSPDGGWIAFQSARGGAWDLYAVAPDGGESRRLTDDAALDYQPAWSPDGRWIAYASTETGSFFLKLADAASGEIVASLPLELDPLLRPAWSADGRSLYFSSNRGGRINVWRSGLTAEEPPAFEEPVRVTFGAGEDIEPSAARSGGRLAFATAQINADVWELDLDTGERRRVTSETSVEDYPDLSPDGSRLLAVTDRRGEIELWLFDAAGRPLDAVGPVASFAFGGRWSPDGRRIAYTRQQGDDLLLTIHTPGEAAETTVGNSAFGAEWSPDGERLLYVTASALDADPYLEVRALSGGEPRRVTPEGSSVTFASWAPDGERVVFSRNEADGSRALGVVAVSGGELRMLATGGQEESHPRWSPVDEDLILFLRDHKNLFLLELSSGRLRQLTDTREANVILDYPAWSRDGRRVVYSVARKTGDLFMTGE